MWTSPSNYDHVATVQQRRAIVTIDDDEVVQMWDKVQPNLKTLLTRWLRDQA